MNIEATSSAEVIQDGFYGEEKGEELFEGKASEISSLAKKCIEGRHTNYHGSLRPAIVFCRHHESNENKSSSGNDNSSNDSGSKEDSHNSFGAEVRGDKNGNRSSVEGRGWIGHGNKQTGKWSAEAYGGVDNKGKTNGGVVGKYEREF
jgi:hypothetical protein